MNDEGRRAVISFIVLIVARINVTVPTVVKARLGSNLAAHTSHFIFCLLTDFSFLPHTAVHCITADLMQPALSLPDHHMLSFLSEISFVFLYLASSAFRD